MLEACAAVQHQAVFVVDCLMMKLRYTAVIERDEDGYFVASVPVLGPGIAAQGRTRRQALARLRGVVESYIGALKLDGDPVPTENTPVTLASVEVAA